MVLSCGANLPVLQDAWHHWHPVIMISENAPLSPIDPEAPSNQFSYHPLDFLSVPWWCRSPFCCKLWSCCCFLLDDSSPPSKSFLTSTAQTPLPWFLQLYASLLWSIYHNFNFTVMVCERVPIGAILLH